MSNDNKGVEAKDGDAPTGDEVQKKDSSASEDQGGVDYKAELERITAENKKIAEERDNYKTGMLNAKDQLKKKGTLKDDESDTEDDIDAKIDAKVAERLAVIENTIAVNTFDSLIGEFSNNSDEQKLIKYHFENSVSPNLPVRERIENAKLIANKSLILKTQSELATALKSKAGVSKFSTAAGGNQDVDKVTKDFFSPEQIESLKKRGLDPDKVKENYLKSLQKSNK